MQCTLMKLDLLASKKQLSFRLLQTTGWYLLGTQEVFYFFVICIAKLIDSFAVIIGTDVKKGASRYNFKFRIAEKHVFAS